MAVNEWVKARLAELASEGLLREPADSAVHLESAPRWAWGLA